MSTLVNKLATAVLIRVGEQYSCQIRDIDSETEDLIQVLSLQAITQSKIRLAADDLELYRKTSSFDQKIVSLSIFISLETESLSFFISLETEFLSFFISFETVLSG